MVLAIIVKEISIHLSARCFTKLATSRSSTERFQMHNDIKQAIRHWDLHQTRDQLSFHLEYPLQNWGGRAHSTDVNSVTIFVPAVASHRGQVALRQS